MMPLSISSRARAVLIAVATVVIYLALRLPGISLPYHQDEWKNVASSATVAAAGQFFAHPPFMQMFFVLDYRLFGIDYFRVLPLLFSIGAAILLYFVMKRRAGQAAALWSVALFTVCFYNILGALQPDVDGAILPFFFLLAVFAYDRLPRKKWFAIFILALLAGFLVKLSFILIVGVFIIDYLWAHLHDKLFKKTAWCAAGFIAFGAIYVALLYLIQAIYPAFSIHFMLTHAHQFVAAAGRDWTQIAAQAMKVMFYLSPLAIVPLLFTTGEAFRKTRAFWLYLAFGFVFYFVLFDFSRAVLDKYLMYAIVPLAAIGGVILADVFKGKVWSSYKRQFITAGVIGVVVALALVAANFLPQTVVALYPKTAWFSRVLHLHWNVLTPFNGGSGPMGFYVSFLFIGTSFLVSLVLMIAAFFKKAWRAPVAIILIMIGIAYNLVFAEELFYGGLNGSAPTLLAQTTAFIAQDPVITKVMTYNDIGAGPLSLMGKYTGRIYATPDSEGQYRQKFAAFDGQYLVIDIPRFDPNGFYYKFFAQCHVLFRATSGQIAGSVYDCPHDIATISKL